MRFYKIVAMKERKKSNTLERAKEEEKHWTENKKN
jgi:hypothetical protein